MQRTQLVIAGADCHVEKERHKINKNRSYGDFHTSCTPWWRDHLGFNLNEGGLRYLAQQLKTLYIDVSDTIAVFIACFLPLRG